MNKFAVVIRTSEFWVALVAAIVSVLTNTGVLTKEAADFVNMAFVYVVGRLVSKTVKNVIPEGGIK